MEKRKLVNVFPDLKPDGFKSWKPEPSGALFDAIMEGQAGAAAIIEARVAAATNEILKRSGIDSLATVRADFDAAMKKGVDHFALMKMTEKPRRDFKEILTERPEIADSLLQHAKTTMKDLSDGNAINRRVGLITFGALAGILQGETLVRVIKEVRPLVATALSDKNEFVRSTAKDISSFLPPEENSAELAAPLPPADHANVSPAKLVATPH